MSWPDFVAIAPAVTGIVMAVLAIVETFIEPRSTKGKLTWVAVFVVLGVVAIEFTIEQQNLAAAQRKHDETSAQQEHRQLDQKFDSAQRLSQKVSGQLDDLKRLTQLKSDESPDKVLAAAALKILDLESAIKEQGQQISDTQSKVHALEPRTISKNQATSMMRGLRSFSPNSVHIIAIMGDTESFTYATQWGRIFKAAGWTVEGIDQGVFSAPMDGLMISVGSKVDIPRSAQIVARILHQNGIQVFGNFDSTIKSGQWTFIVGSAH